MRLTRVWDERHDEVIRLTGSTSRAATVRRESSPLFPSPDLTRGRRRRYAFVFIAQFLPFRVLRLHGKRRSRLRRRAHARRRTKFLSLAAIPEEKIELSDRTKGKHEHESVSYTGLNRPDWFFPDSNQSHGSPPRIYLFCKFFTTARFSSPYLTSPNKRRYGKHCQ